MFSSNIFYSTVDWSSNVVCILSRCVLKYQNLEDKRDKIITGTNKKSPKESSIITGIESTNLGQTPQMQQIY